LAYWALAKCYGYDGGIACSGPSFKSMEVKNSAAVLSFDGANEGFAFVGDITGFEVAGSDRIFHPAKATLLFNEKKISVEASEVATPVAVRYCFKNYSHGNLYNLKGLPVVPFRTDSWE